MRERWIKLNAMELGYLWASIPPDQLAKMEEDCPKLWLQLMIGITESYAYDANHPWKNKAWKDLQKYKARLHRLLIKEEKYNKEHQTAS